MSRYVRLIPTLMACGLLACFVPAAPTTAQDVSAAPILQFFESTSANTAYRMPDIFMAGYGAVQVPPPYRADTGGFSVGYDVYDRFDLGGPGDPTLYGTQSSFQRMANEAHAAGLSVYTDLVWNHNGFRDMGTPGFLEQGAYPGFALTLQDSDPSAPGYNTQGYSAIDGDFHGAFEGGDLNGRLAGLIDINHSTNFQFIRQPVASDSRNIPGGFIDPANARYYPDTDLSPILVFDPTTGEANIAIYPFNTADPTAGDAVPENALGYLMRHTQWMVQVIGVDGFRIDAAKNFEPWVLNYLDRAVYRSNPRTLLDGSTAHVFSYGEVFDGDMGVLQSRIRKDINPADPGAIGGNRDALDFPLYFALRSNLTSNGLVNDWHNVINASIDVNDDGLANNGSQGVSFVSGHDSGIPLPDLSNVAYAFTLMRPGNTVVYQNAKQFGEDRDFPIDGRGDALGGFYGDLITTLVDIRDTHGRGNFLIRTLEKESLAFERENAALVLLSNRSDAGFDSRTIQTAFAPGTPLIELTGNASDPSVDPRDDIPALLVVNADGTINARFLRNSSFDQDNNSFFTGRGYLIYGLATPQGTLSLTNVDRVLPGGTPTAQTNGTTRLTDIEVITADSFDVQLDTVAVNLLGFYRDHDADGDNALLRLDGGIDLNGNGIVDHVTPGTVAYGFEQFTTVHDPGYFNADGNGRYVQAIDATRLSEGYHYLHIRAFRHRDAGPAVFSNFRKVIYIDRLPPESGLHSFNPITPGVNENRDLVAVSLDHTADNMHLFLDLPAALTGEQVLAMISGASQADFLDTDLWKKTFTGLTSGNHVATIVTFEITGNVSVKRVAGLLISTIYGAGLGDTDFNGSYSPHDIDVFAQVFDSQNTQFNAAADLNGDGLIDLADAYLLGDRLSDVGADFATIQAYQAFIAQVPEPASCLLVIVSGFLLLRRLPRRTAASA